MPTPPAPESPPPADNGPVAFDRETAVRVGEVVKYVEQYHRLPPAKGVRRSNFDIATYIARVTTTCNARSGSTPGANGRGYLQKWSGTSLSDDTAAGLQVILNLQNKTFVAGSSSYTPVVLAYGAWWLPAPADCTLIV